MRIRSGSRWLWLAAGALVLTLWPGCSDDEIGLTRPPDSIPPASSQLFIQDVTMNSVTLQWSAPGNNGMDGEARGVYDLRYATTVFDDLSWETATVAPNLDPPLPPRTAELITIEGLTPGTTYFFSLRTRDNAGNWSEPSQLINATVPLEDGFPVLWNGGLQTKEGTTSTGFVYRVTQMTSAEQAGLVPLVVVSDSAYAMTLVAEEGAGIGLYEFDTLLEQGLYDYYFSVSDTSGQTTRLPSQGTWTGPTVSSVERVEAATVEIPAGTFLMGSPNPASHLDERPQHEVTLTHDIELDRFPVTNSQLCEAYNWAYENELLAVHDDTLATTPGGGYVLLIAEPRGGDGSRGVRFAAATGFTSLPGRENWPATHVTWFGAAFYCNVRSLQEERAVAYSASNWNNIPHGQPYVATGWRLPTEAEWEYAARCDDGRAYPSGNTPPVPDVDGNFAGVLGHPSPVGYYPQGTSPWGLDDLIGNVWEWCNDWKTLYPDGAVIDPIGHWSSTEFRVMRGGSWSSTSDEVRCASRFSLRPDAFADGLGFRCARSLN